MNKFTKNIRALKPFLVLWTGQTISSIGSAATASALIIWAYTQRGTVASVALLSVCSYLPVACVALFAGSLADRISKKKIMLAADASAALTTLAVYLLWKTSLLRVEYLYLINACLGVAGAFQSPASTAAVSALVPKEQYMRVSGLQSLSGSLVGILSPVLAGVLMGGYGLGAVILVDLTTFAAAFATLLLFVRIPHIAVPDAAEPLRRRLMGGVRFLRESKGVTRIIEYVILLNLIAGISYYSVLSPMILARTGGDAAAMGAVNAFIGVGALIGAALTSVITIKKPKMIIMCVAYTLSFALCDIPMGLGRTMGVWCAAAALGSLPLPFGDGALTALMRGNIPLSVQGRVFAVRNAAISCTTTAGYLLGAWLADAVAPTLVKEGSPLAALLGTGEGRAMGFVFLLSGIVGIVGSLSLLTSKAVRALKE